MSSDTYLKKFGIKNSAAVRHMGNEEGDIWIESAPGFDEQGNPCIIATFRRAEPATDSPELERLRQALDTVRQYHTDAVARADALREERDALREALEMVISDTGDVRSYAERNNLHIDLYDLDYEGDFLDALREIANSALKKAKEAPSSIAMSKALEAIRDNTQDAYIAANDLTMLSASMQIGKPLSVNQQIARHALDAPRPVMRPWQERVSQSDAPPPMGADPRAFDSDITNIAEYMETSPHEREQSEVKALREKLAEAEGTLHTLRLINEIHFNAVQAFAGINNEGMVFENYFDSYCEHIGMTDGDLWDDGDLLDVIKKLANHALIESGKIHIAALTS